MKNKETILDTIIKARNGHYCHALEVSDTYELECAIEAVTEEFPNHTLTEVTEFFESMSIYFLGDDEGLEREVYDFNFSEFIDNNYYI